MDILKTVITIIFVIDCIALAAIILLQEGKASGLGTISGAADTYWGHNKGRSMEGDSRKSYPRGSSSLHRISCSPQP